MKQAVVGEARLGERSVRLSRLGSEGRGGSWTDG